MKKFTLVVFLLAILGGAIAQDKKSKDYVVMKEGKVLVVRDGKTTSVDKEIVLGDGTRVMADGKVMMKDGSTKILKEGETLPLAGTQKSKKDPGSR